MKRFRRFVFAFLIAMSASAPTALWADIPLADQAQILVNKGSEFAGQEKYKEAIDQYIKALAISPKEGGGADPLLITAQAGALFAMGEAQRNSDQLDRALATYAEILKTYPRHRHICAESGTGIAKVYQKKENYPKALQQYAETLKNWPEKFVTTDLARFRIEYLRQKMKGYPPDLESSINAAIQAYENAKADNDALKSAITLAQTDTASSGLDARRNRLTSLLVLPGIKKSRDLLFTLACAQLRALDIEHTRLTLKEYLELAYIESPPDHYRWAKTDAYYKLGDYSKVIPEAKMALSIYPDGTYSGEIRGYLADAYCRTGQFDKAAAVWEGAKAKTVDQQAYKYDTVGAMHLRAGNYMKAVSAFEREIRIKGASPDTITRAKYNLGECYNRMGDYRTARKYLQMVIDEAPDSSWASKARGTFYIWSAAEGEEVDP